MECHQNDDALVIGYRPQSVANVLSVYLLSIFSFYILCHARHVSVSFFLMMMMMSWKQVQEVFSLMLSFWCWVAMLLMCIICKVGRFYEDGLQPTVIILLWEKSHLIPITKYSIMSGSLISKDAKLQMSLRALSFICTIKAFERVRLRWTCRHIWSAFNYISIMVWWAFPILCFCSIH